MKELHEGHQEGNHTMNLNFNAPLLSTRRPANLTAIDLSSCPSVRRRSSDVAEHCTIPFSWEKAPGKPKETKIDKCDEENDTPRPKLPPSLWRYRDIISTITAKNDENFIFEASSNDNNYDNDMNNSDDVDSLSEAIDIAERSQEKSHETDGLRLKIIQDRTRNDNQYPDFIIQRFLPDATALATASAISSMSLKKSSSSSDSHRHFREFQIPLAKRKISLSFSLPKGCGLMTTLFPWRVKKTLRGVKSPVRRGISGGFSCTSSIDQVLQRRHKENIR